MYFAQHFILFICFCLFFGHMPHNILHLHTVIFPFVLSLSLFSLDLASVFLSLPSPPSSLLSDAGVSLPEGSGKAHLPAPFIALHFDFKSGRKTKLVWKETAVYVPGFRFFCLLLQLCVCACVCEKLYTHRKVIIPLLFFSFMFILMPGTTKGVLLEEYNEHNKNKGNYIILCPI